MDHLSLTTLSDDLLCAILGWLGMREVLRSGATSRALRNCSLCPSLSCFEAVNLLDCGATRESVAALTAALCGRGGNNTLRALAFPRGMSDCSFMDHLWRPGFRSLERGTATSCKNMFRRE